MGFNSRVRSFDEQLVTSCRNLSGIPDSYQCCRSIRWVFGFGGSDRQRKALQFDQTGESLLLCLGLSISESRCEGFCHGTSKLYLIPSRDCEGAAVIGCLVEGNEYHCHQRPDGAEGKWGDLSAKTGALPVQGVRERTGWAN
jgi:hypothetical protein